MPGEFNGFFTIKQMECFDSRSREKHSTTISVSPCSSFVLQLLSTCFTTEQSTVEASLCICSRNSSRHNLIKKLSMDPPVSPVMKTINSRKAEGNRTNDPNMSFPFVDSCRSV